MHAGTFNSYNIGIAASLATIRLMAENRQEVHRRIRKNGKALMSGIRRIARKQKKPLLVQGLGPMFHVGFTPKKEITSFRDCDSYDAARYGQVVSAMRERGVRLIGRGIWYVSAAHTEKDVEKTLALLEDVMSNE
jgi:glutamate-1-semialdehyde 2,1-aminomutase